MAGGVNLYSYAGSNPISFSDPFGLDAADDPKSTLGQKISDVVAAFFSSIEGKAITAMAQAVTVIGGILDYIPGITSASEATGGIDRKGNAMSGGQQVVALGMTLGEGFAAGGSKVIAGKITGFTKHGINSAISHDGVGVSVQALRDAVANPSKVVQQVEGKVKYVGKNATVILNKIGEVVSTWARSSAGWRIPP